MLSTEGPIVVTTYHSKRRRPVRRRPTTTEKHPNHKYPEEPPTEATNKITSLPSSGIRIIEPPKFSPSDVNDGLYKLENHTQHLKKETSQSLNYIPERQLLIPTAVGTTKQSTTDIPLTDLVPEHLKGVLADMTPEQLIKGNPPKPNPATKAPSAEEEDIKNMLAAFGMLPLKTTTTTAIPDISSVADNLSPEMKDLLVSFGLIPNPQETLASASQVVESYNPVKAEVKPESYVGFKPLPEDQSSRHEMEELLARFGLGRSSRQEKSLPKKREEHLSFDAVPDEFKGVLDDIGLTNRQGKMIKAETLIKTLDKQHVFNPVDKQYASNEELEKLNKLLDVVKQLEKINGTVTDEDLKNIDVDNLRELVSSLNEENRIVPLDEQNAPNPVNYDYGLNKNDVKRQENSSSTTTPIPTTTEEAKTSNLKDLEDSFGGLSDSSPATETPTPETTTQARRTGFYYLVDWNTFLDIDDQKGKRVNLRFQPTIGDPKRFYSVSVP
ncbi:hypothetical protein NQ314_001279 [Rhamnusium bicolor]|uniref:Uncharacterized protein n=1 Tax=Rhamnusium bicolor TaxID=1586634 RepID=A0AAV8ZSC4_9CUCU|nr:hypothetical protein NQ314_001279 [Rhamnusium bicolor]